jgi:hypothetical protein
MQNRRIIDRLLRSAGAEPSPTLESNSMIVLFANVRTGKWASIMPAKLAETLGLTESTIASCFASATSALISGGVGSRSE